MRAMNNWNFKITEVVEDETGAITLHFDVDDEFVEWFKKWQGLKRWSQKRFQKMMVEAFSRYLQDTQGHKHLDNALRAADLAAYEEEVELYKTYGGD